MTAGDNVVFAVGVNPDQGGGMTLFDNLTVTQVPEPSTFAFALAGGLAWAGSRRRRHNH
jgi:MYXO-CTERM domain-containing protein